MDGRNHLSDMEFEDDEPGHYLQCLADDIKRDYLLFIRQFNSNYSTFQNGALVNGQKELFESTALHFALTIYHYYEVIKAEDRCDFSYPFSPQSLMKTLSEDLSFIDTTLAEMFLSYINNPAKSLQQYTEFIPNLGDIHIFSGDSAHGGK